MEKFLILGISNGGLFLARQLRRQWPDSIIYAVGDIKKDIGRFSNAINRFFGFHSIDELHSTIEKAYQDIGGGTVHAYMCTNPILECILRNHSELFEYLTFENPHQVYQKFVDKNKAIQLCQQLNVNIPEEYEMTDIENTNISFPVVIKPLEKASTIGADKCMYISDIETLKNYVKRIESNHIDRSKLICQQCVQGDNRWEYGYGGFFKDGEPTVDICFYQFRQVPQGLCCYCREMTDNHLQHQIKALVEPILKATRYNGFMEFDIKQDEFSKELFLLDINPRPWRSSDMLAAKIKGSTIFQPIISDKKIVWRYRYRELNSGINKKNVSYSTCKELTKGYKTKSQQTLYDTKDIKPYIYQWKQDVGELFGKVFSRVRK